MNHIYRVVFNRALGIYQVASELTRRQGKRGGAVSGIVAASLLALAVDTAVAGGDGGYGAGYANEEDTGAGWQAGDPAGPGGRGGDGSSGNGGAGGQIGQAGVAGITGGGGGGGGTGDVVAGSGATYSISGLVFFGDGGAGAALMGIGAGGGGGGAGIRFTGAYDLISNSADVRGGKGGNSAGGGGGGGGGAGIILGNGLVTLNNMGTIRGGNGGVGGFEGLGGRGGAGEGAVGDRSGKGGTRTTLSTGGAGIVGPAGGGLHIINVGTIAGGFNAALDEQADAIYFQSNVGANQNILELHSTSDIQGRVWAGSGGGDVLRLGGSTNGTFAVDQISASDDVNKQFIGFETFEKTGSSAWTLSGATSEVTPWTIGGGSLVIAEDASLGDVSGTLTLDDGTLHVTSNMVTSRQMVLEGAGGSFRIDSGRIVEFEGEVGGTGELRKTNDGRLMLGGVNTYQGGTIVQAGTLYISRDENLGLAGTALSLSSGASLAVTGATAFSSTRALILGFPWANVAVVSGQQLTWDGLVSGGSLRKWEPGTLVLTADNTYSGGTSLAGGVLSIRKDGNLGDASTVTAKTVTFGGGQLSYHDAGAAATQTLDRRLVLNQAATLDVDLGGDADKTLVLQDVSAGAGHQVTAGNGGLTIQGVGRVIVAGNASHLGGTIVSNAGGLQIGNGGAEGSLTGDVALNHADGLTFSRTGAQTHGGVISGIGKVEKLGANTLTLTGINSYEGGTRVGGGTVVVTQHANLGQAGAGLELDSATLRVNATDFTVLDRAVSLGNAFGVLHIDSVANTVTATQTIDGLGELRKSGSGRLTLTGTNTYAGGTSVAGGALSISKDANLGAAGTRITLDGGALEITGGPDPEFEAIARDVVLGFNHGWFDVVQADRVISLDGQISGVGQLRKRGAGTLVLTDTTHTYEGGVTIVGGALQIGSDANLSGVSPLITFESGGVLAYRNAGAAASQDLDRQFLMTIGGGALDLDLGGDADKALRLTGTISGSGGLTTTGVGRVVLTEAASHLGGTIIANAGGLQVGEGGVSGALSPSGSVVNNTWLGFNRSDDVSVGVVISGTGQVAQLGAGALTLSGINFYQGGTHVSGGGTVRVANNSNLGAAGGAVSLDAGTLQITGALLTSTARQLHLNGLAPGSNVVDIGAGATSFTGVIAGAGGLTKVGAGTMTLTGTNTYEGGTAVSGGGGGVDFARCEPGSVGHGCEPG